MSDGPKKSDQQAPKERQWDLELSESKQRHFDNFATGYGVEVYGGTPEDREAALRDQFGDPVVVVDGRDVDSQEELVKSALLDMGISKNELESRFSIGSIDLKRALIESQSHIILTEFDSMSSEVQTNVARMMKGIAEDWDLDGVEIMLGYTCEEKGAVVRAERDLSIRVRSWGLERDRNEE